MDRRRFLSRLTAASAAVGLDVGCGERGAVYATRRAVYQVRGFTCITCAVGLEVMLRGLRGVTEASASYPESSVAVAFDEQLISEDALKQFIVSCGFFAA
jgi:copper chaperone